MSADVEVRLGQVWRHKRGKRQWTVVLDEGHGHWSICSERTASGSHHTKSLLLTAARLTRDYVLVEEPAR